MNFNNCKVMGIPAKCWKQFYLEWDDPSRDPEYDPHNDISWTTYRLCYWQTADGKCYVRESHTGHTPGCFWTKEPSEEITLEDFCTALVNGFFEGFLLV